MARQVVIDNENVTLWYDADKQIVGHKVKKFIFGEAFQKFLMTGTDLMRKNHAHKWLSDDRDSPILRKEDTDWSTANWFPQTVSAGWKYWAIVQSVQPMGKMNLEELAAVFAKLGVITSFFTDPQEAEKWLDSQKV
jgi:hypothetical protein